MSKEVSVSHSLPVPPSSSAEPAAQSSLPVTAAPLDENAKANSDNHHEDDAVVAAAAVNSDSDACGSETSLESDYYYDDAGRPHTYYRPKRFHHRDPKNDDSKKRRRRRDKNTPTIDNNGTLANEPFATEVVIEDGGTELVNRNTSKRGGEEKSQPPSRSTSGLTKRTASSYAIAAASYPADNGSIYIAPLPPPSTRNHHHHHHDDDKDAAADDDEKSRKRSSRKKNKKQNEESKDGSPVVADAASTTEMSTDEDATTKGDGPSRQVTAASFCEVQIENKSIAALPTHGLRKLGHTIHKLSTEELLYISAMVSRKANREIFSILQYSGEAWYLPEVRRTRPDEKRWGIDYQWGVGLILSVAGRRITFRVLSYFIRLSIMAAIWFIFWASTIPKSWSYRSGYLLDPYVTVLVSAIVGGIVCRILAIPPLVGVFWMGIIWHNIGPEVGYFTKGILPQVRTISSRSGLAIILLRAGFSISIKSVLPIVKNVFLNASTYVAESIVQSMVAMFYLGYDNWKWAFAHGILNSVVGAAIVVPGVLVLQAEGYSRSSGPLPLMLSTVGIESPIGVWASSFCIGLLTSDDSIGYLAGMGPVQIVGGLVAGFIAAIILHFAIIIMRNEAKPLPTGRYSQDHMVNVYRGACVLIILACHALLFLAYDIEMTGGGVVALISTTFFLSNYWGRERKGEGPNGELTAEQKADEQEWLDLRSGVATRLAAVWDLAAMPYLFSLAGTKIVLSKVFNKDPFPKALLITVIGAATRAVTTAYGSLGLGFSWKERLFHMGASTSKATIQIALGSVPLDFFTKKLQALPLDSPDRASVEQSLANAELMWSCAVLTVICFAPFSAIWITRLGPLLLKKE